MIDPRLMALRVLAERGTVTAAAEVLHLTPSTVSVQLRQLAAQVGVDLLEPQGRRVKLTPAAQTLLRHADLLYAQWEQAEADLAAHRDEAAGHLRISAIATAITALVVPAAAELRRLYPRMTLDIREDAKQNRFELLLTDHTDIAVMLPTPDGPPVDDPRFTQQTLLEEPLTLLVPTTHPLAARQDGVELSEAAEETWIRAGDPSDQHRLTEAACAAAGFTPRVTCDAIDWFAIAALVAHGYGIALIPSLAPIPTHYDVTRVPLQGTTTPVRRLIACIRRGREQQPTIAHGLTALRTAAHDIRGTESGTEKR